MAAWWQQVYFQLWNQRCRSINSDTRLTALFPGLPRWASTRKVNQSGFYWSKRQWVAMASAGPYASLHLAPDRQPHQHPTSHFHRPDALPAAQPTASKHWRQSIKGNIKHYRGNCNQWPGLIHFLFHQLICHLTDTSTNCSNSTVLYYSITCNCHSNWLKPSNIAREPPLLHSISLTNSFCHLKISLGRRKWYDTDV